MIVRAGTAVSFPVLFSLGHPDANVTWQVLSPLGVVLDSGSIAPAADAVSTLVPVSGALNALAGSELLSYRDVTWTYSVAGEVIHDEVRYTIEARVPFGVSADGVRLKLGVDTDDLPDPSVSLVSAYYEFVNLLKTPQLAGESVIADALTANGHTQLLIRNSIEALAALALLPTMVVRIADKESSGTNQYQRQKIDWAALRLFLQSEISIGRIALLPLLDVTADFTPLLILASPARNLFPGG